MEPYQFEVDGKLFGTGNIDAPIRMKHAIYGESEDTPLVPESQWEAIAMQYEPDKPGMSTLTYVHDQNGYGMCNASATASVIETQEIKSGGALVKLSGGDLYNRICGGSDRGSMLEDGLEESKNGIATVDECPYLEWRRRSAGTTRSQHRVLEWYLCPTFAACFSAVCYGFDLVTGIMWYDNFNPDNTGWLPKRGSGRPGGHAIHGYKPAYGGGRAGIWHKNSWTTRYGIGGHMVIGREHYQGSVGGWWACRVVTAPKGDVLPNPRF